MELINWLVSLCSKSVKKTLRRVIIFVSPSYLLFTACFLKNIACQVLEKKFPSPITHCSPRSILSLRTSVHTARVSFPKRIELWKDKFYSLLSIKYICTFEKGKKEKIKYSRNPCETRNKEEHSNFRKSMTKQA